ncbi:MAG: 50S ribosomal protein L17 [Fibrobacteres bacterium]|nr:50S ribosomal protein L17 [Fibrobacterota bacterium]
MRHQKRGRKLSRTSSHRKAMLGNLATSLLRYNRVETGHAKALEVRGVVERLITYAKKGDLHSRRLAATTIKDADVLKKLFAEIAPQYKERNGGYTRVMKKGYRVGDAAPTSIIELVGLAQMEKEVVAPAKKSPEDKKKGDSK